MATSDLTRDIFDPRKQYRSLRLQQGRVLSDDDPNEAERIRLEDERRARLEIVGPYGSPDDGFRIRDPGSVDGGVDFRIGPGSLWVGGIRFERSEEESYREQTDWLTNPLSDSDEGDVRAPQGERRDLVYVECWLQPVSAVEDGELFEVALGGPDTSTRLRSMCRVKVRTGVDTGDCGAAWEDLVAEWEAENRGRVNGERELVVDTRLRVGFEPEGEAEDLCTPSVEEGYLGAENQAIRVELLTGERIIWGFDNGAPVYRAREAAGDEDVVVLLTDPRDEAHRPRPGQVVELLPWGAVLVNGEKLADDLEPGFFAFVDSYDPDTGRLTLNRALTDGDDFLERAECWRDREDEGELRETRFGREAIPEEEEDLARFYLRVWDQGRVRNGDGPAPGEVPGIELDGGPAGLTGTGLTVEVLGEDYRPGDYWIVSARPEAPDRVVPWELQRDTDDDAGLEGRRPHGVRRFYAPLAVIEWNAGDEADPHLVHDCRPPFRPLTETDGCCRFTVGDGVRSQGHFRDLQRAVDALPPEGGEICLLPGLHEASVLVNRRDNIVIRGCGKQTRVIPAPDRRAAPVFHVRDSRCVVLERMDLTTFTGSAVVLESSGVDSLHDVAVRENRIHASVRGVEVHGGTNTRIRENGIRILDTEEGGVGVYSRAGRCAIEENDVSVVPIDEEPPPVEEPDGGVLDPGDRCEDPERLYGSFDFLAGYLDWLWVLPLPELLAGRDEPAPFRALGGIQVAAGSRATRVRENRILGGTGNGVTLGGARQPPLPGAPEGDDEGEITIELTSDVSPLTGTVDSSDGGVSGVEVEFTPRGDPSETLRAVTGEDGDFSIEGGAREGAYLVSVAPSSDDSGLMYRVVDASVEEEGSEMRSANVDITVEVIEREPADPFRPLLDIEVVGNRIRRMGLSGVGTAVAAGVVADSQPVQLSQARNTGLENFGVPVLGLDILDNRIHGCLKTPFDSPRGAAIGMEAQARRKGLGGISVGIASSVRVRDNVVEANGSSHVDPVCGVFLGLAGGVDVSGNRILNNGPVEEESDGGLDSGIRGGIVIQFAVPPWDNKPDAAAASVAENTVSQPAGRALTISMAIGSISVRGNGFEAEGRSGHELEELAGAVWIVNTGGRQESTGSRGETNMMSAVPALAFRSGQASSAGKVDFSHNQVRLGREAEAGGSQLIASLDDLTYSNNQCEAFLQGRMLYDVYLMGTWVRASGNSLREPAQWERDAGITGDAPLVSLVSLGLLLNNTSHNQADFCIVPTRLSAPPLLPLPGSLVAQGNQQLISSWFQGLAASFEGFEIETDPCANLQDVELDFN